MFLLLWELRLSLLRLLYQTLIVFFALTFRDVLSYIFFCIWIINDDCWVMNNA